MQINSLLCEKILLIYVLMISGVQSRLSIGKMFPISGLGGRGGGGGGFPISFILLWGCIRDSGGVDLQTKLYERDRDSGKEIPHKESFPKVESPMNPRIVVYKSA